MKKDKLTFKQKKFVSEYIKGGNASAAARAVYKTKNSGIIGWRLTKIPKVQNAIQEALLAANLDEGYASAVLKEIIAAGVVNKEATRPSDSLKGLELFFQLKGYLGKNGQNDSDEEKANSMTTDEIVQELDKLTKTQERLIKLYKEGAVEGEILDEHSEGGDNPVQPEHQQVDK